MGKVYAYNQFDRPISKTYSVNGTEKEKHTYVYDKNNRVVIETQVNNWPTSSGAVVNESITYEYDLASQLIKSVKTNLNDNSVETTEYGYDAVGNRTAEKIGNILTQYDYDTLNRLNKTAESVSGVRETEANYNYDANGSLIEVSEGTTVTTYTYDASNQMKQATKTENGVVTLTQNNEYNGEGQRIRKTEGSDITNYFYEGSSLLYTTDGSNALKGFIIYDGNGDLLRQIQSGNANYTYTTDIQGSIVNLVDSSANSVVSYTYTDFGETVEKSDSDVYNELRYTGGVYDEATGLYYLNARFYDPEIGRFLNPDSYRGEPVDPQTLHLYAYCANDPINHVDPTGHVIGTVLDVISVIDSTRTFVRDPSLLAGAILAYDIVAAAIPGVPASAPAKATVKGIKNVAKLTDTAADTVKAAKKTAKVGKKVAKATTKASKTTKSVTQKASKNATKNLQNNIVVYDAEFAARQIVQNGAVDEAGLLSLVPKGTPNTFVPTQSIAKGYKYEFKINDQKISVKWHSEDLVAKTKYPDSNSGKGWTAQIKVGKKLVGQDKKMYRSANNATHIPVKRHKR